MGASRAQIARVQALGYAGWLDEQFAMPPSQSRWDWLVDNGLDTLAYKKGEKGADATIWRKLLVAPDTLRQRVTLALSEILVTSVSSFRGGWKAFTAAAYLDLLESEAFGNYGKLLEKVSTSVAMGEYLTFRGNGKFNPKTGATPDENYARELLQLFSIGLLALETDGTVKTVGGQPIETYVQDDIGGLARVFTGWNYDFGTGDNSTPHYKRRPMANFPRRHEPGSKTFLGNTIPANLGGAEDVRRAIGIIFAHPNVAPFIGRQLIQRLVCSNPSPAYIERVAGVFNNDGTGARGNLKAVVRAILLDDEARSPTRLADPAWGKQREPILRMAGWARAFDADSASGAWRVGNTSNPATRLGQSPLRSPSVFNFYRPGYVPPNTAIASAGLVAPEFQATNESSVVGYVNFMQRTVSQGFGDVRANYTPLMSLAGNADALLAELNLVLAAGQVSAPTMAMLARAVDSMPAGSQPARLRRIHAALTLVLASPEYIVQK